MKTLKKKPIQIYIDVGQDTLLDALSRRRGISKAAIIRESIEKMLREMPVEEDPAMELMGMGGSGKRTWLNSTTGISLNTPPQERNDITGKYLYRYRSMDRTCR